MRHAIRLAVIAALCAASAVPARAGVELTTETVDLGLAQKDGAAKAPPKQGRTVVDGDRLRMELPDVIMIFRGDRDLAWMLRPGEHSYTEIDRATLEQMQAKIEAGRAHMRAQLEKLPPEQRAQMEKMMEAHGIGDAARGAPPAREAPRVQPTGRTDAVGGLGCREVEVTRGAEKESEVCVADWTTAGVTKDDLRVYRKLGAFHETIRKDAPTAPDVGSGSDLSTLFDQLDGVPVRVRSFRGGVPRTEMRIVGIEKKAVDATLFEVPAGYAKRSVPGHEPPGAAPAK